MAITWKRKIKVRPTCSPLQELEATSETRLNCSERILEILMRLLNLMSPDLVNSFHLNDKCRGCFYLVEKMDELDAATLL
jgi:hypothetical protein